MTELFSLPSSVYKAKENLIYETILILLFEAFAMALTERREDCPTRAELDADWPIHP